MSTPAVIAVADLCRSVCLVRVRGRDPQRVKSRHHEFGVAQNGSTVLTGSGYIVPHRTDPGRHIVVCSGNLILPFLAGVDAAAVTSNSNSSSSRWKTLRGGPTTNASTLRTESVRTLLPETIIDVLLDHSLQEDSDQEDNKHDFSFWKCRLACVGEAYGVQEGIHALTQGANHLWTLGWKEVAIAQTKTLSSSLTPSAGLVAVLELVDDTANALLLRLQPDPEHNNRRVGSTMAQSKHLRRGDPIVVVSSPFGLMSPRVFLNSVSKGVVSNICGDGGCLFVTDARCLAGSEGGAVFDKHNDFVGLVTLPVRHQNSAVHMNLFIGSSSLDFFLQEHYYKLRKCYYQQHAQGPTSTTTSPTDTVFVTASANWSTISKQIEAAESSIVAVKIGTTWSTGVIVSRDGFIITNAHLVEPFLQKRANKSSKFVQPSQQVWVRITDRQVKNQHDEKQQYICSTLGPFGTWLHAIVVYICDGPWDICLLKVRCEQLLCPLREAIDTVETASQGRVRKGDDVFVIGHALFAPPSNLRPTVTAGTVANVVHLKKNRDKRPILLQSTALVHSGNSGCVMMTTNGRVVGIVVNNIKYTPATVSPTQQERIIPEINFAIPIEVLQPLFEFCRMKPNQRDAKLLMLLNDDDESIDAIWKLAESDAVPKVSTKTPFPKRLKSLMKKTSSKL